MNAAIYALIILLVSMVVVLATMLERRRRMHDDDRGQLVWLQDERRRLIGLIHFYRVQCPEVARDEPGHVVLDERRLYRQN